MLPTSWSARLSPGQIHRAKHMLFGFFQLLSRWTFLNKMVLSFKLQLKMLSMYKRLRNATRKDSFLSYYPSLSINALL